MKNIPMISLLCLVLGGLSLIASDANITVDAAEFGLKSGQDATPALRAAMEACRARKAQTLRIPPGDYPCLPDFAEEKYCFVANNDPGLKRVLLLVKGFDQFTVDGTGAHFICQGQMTPIVIEDSSDITLKGFSIDWNHPFCLEGEVVAIDPATNSFDLQLSPETIYEMHHDHVAFLEKPSRSPNSWKQWAEQPTQDIGWWQNIQWNTWFDFKTKVPWPAEGRYALEPDPMVTEIKPGLLRIFDSTKNMPCVGMGLTVKGRVNMNRTSAAISLSHSRDLKLLDVTVHHAGGMGVVAQRCENLTLERFKVVLPEGSKRLVTTTADATHFNGCRGKILLKDCFFENMLDDATNIHGCFVKVESAINPNTLLCRRIHSQQVGLVIAGPGDKMRLINATNLQPYADLTVSSVRDLNGDLCEITMSEPITDILKPNSGIYNLTWQPDFTMEGCTVRNNRARTMLLSTAGRVEILNNHFEHSSTAGIQFEGGTGFWWECGPVRDVLIRGNTFVDIMGPIITAIPDIDVKRFPDAKYHGGIVMENNRIEAFCLPLVVMRSVHGFVFRNNQIRQSHAFPELAPKSPTFLFMACDDITLSNNTYTWDKPATVMCLNGSPQPTLKDNQGFAEK